MQKNIYAVEEKDWFKKYRPRTLRELVGNPQGITTILRWFDQYRVKPLCITGPSGSGKRSALEVIASTKGYQVFIATEKNISDALLNQTLFHGKRIVCCYVDSKAQMEKLAKLKYRVPFVFITQSQVYSRNVQILKWNRPSIESIMKRMDFILKSELIQMDQVTLRQIIQQSQQDIRHLLNALMFTFVQTSGSKADKVDLDMKKDEIYWLDKPMLIKFMFHDKNMELRERFYDYEIGRRIFDLYPYATQTIEAVCQVAEAMSDTDRYESSRCSAMLHLRALSFCDKLLPSPVLYQYESRGACTRKNMEEKVRKIQHKRKTFMSWKKYRLEYPIP